MNRNKNEERKNQEYLNKFVYDMQVDNEMRAIKKTKSSINLWEQKEMQILNRLKDTQSQHQAVLADLFKVQADSRNYLNGRKRESAGSSEATGSVKSRFNGNLNPVPERQKTAE